jgi:tetratricopeptide (TPR) repeat protein
MLPAQEVPGFFFRTPVYDLAEVQASFRGRVNMAFHILKFRVMTLVGAGCLLLPLLGLAQAPSANPSAGPPVQSEIVHSSLLVYVRELNGETISSQALVTVTRTANQYWQQMTAHGGQASFNDISPGRYTVQAIAAGYEEAVEELEIVGGEGQSVIVSLRPELPGGEATPVVSDPPLLVAKAQKELAKALEALRVGKLAEARKHLDAVYRLAPTHPDVNFGFGVYSSQVNDWQQARSYWEKALTFYPQHLLAQISLSDALLRENKPKDAISHLEKALEIEPNSWRAHALLADADLRVGSSEDAVRQAERAIALGKERAAVIRPLLARALVAQGKADRAVQILESYLAEHPADTDAQKQLTSLRTPRDISAIPISSAPAAPAVSVTPVAGTPPILATLPLFPSWLPPDIDEKVPPVQPGVPCALDEVIQNVGKRVRELVRNVDRFTATESLFHEPVNAWGFPAPSQTRKFNYVVSIQEVRPGMFAVYEYRGGDLSYDTFPGGMATLGLPALVLIFHPEGAVNYDMQCEGLAHWNGVLAWQVHFRQRPDKPIRDRAYRFGGSGPAYPVALKGRAWIAADSYQIMRLETDLVAPLPEIRLFADHTAIEYSAVHFHKQNVDMWLPSTAEIFYDLKGRRVHRRHSFSSYMLFSVDDKQRISAPKTEQAPPTESPPEPTKPNPS